MRAIARQVSRACAGVCCAATSSCEGVSKKPFEARMRCTSPPSWSTAISSGACGSGLAAANASFSERTCAGPVTL